MCGVRALGQSGAQPSVLHLSASQESLTGSAPVPRLSRAHERRARPFPTRHRPAPHCVEKVAGRRAASYGRPEAQPRRREGRV